MGECWNAFRFHDIHRIKSVVFSHNWGWIWLNNFSLARIRPPQVIWGLHFWFNNLRSHWNRDTKWVSKCLSHQDASIDALWHDPLGLKIDIDLRPSLLAFWGTSLTYTFDCLKKKNTIVLIFAIFLRWTVNWKRFLRKRSFFVSTTGLYTIDPRSNLMSEVTRSPHGLLMALFRLDLARVTFSTNYPDIAWSPISEKMYPLRERPLTLNKPLMKCTHSPKYVILIAWGSFHVKSIKKSTDPLRFC